MNERVENFKKIKKVLWAVLGLNLSVAFLKILVGYSISSSSMMADGFHSLSDASTNIIGLIGAALASKPADATHPYGHGKFETFTATGIALMLFLVSFNIIKSGIERLLNPRIPEVNSFSLIIMFITLAVNIGVILYEDMEGKKLHSHILISDAAHTRSDLYVSLSVIAGLIAVKLGYPIVDPLISFVIALLILKAGIEIIKDTSRVLCDAAVVDPEKIASLVRNIRGVVDCHGVRTRGREDDFSMDLHILVNPSMTVEESHRLHHSIEEEIRRNFKGAHHILIHIEPYPDSSNQNT
ncbi:cation diffusion facilitator family transporter [Thermosediminibacter oceani]|uniref:Cation diffusion facilitator family transporter n=1 Tax=Thermosediminibacter oceani (strain ATCC BAA-1034 / DSM 16646 / JW/IW-1228P) TaxID=555079 RepID=D9S025_THEOJ|nr:cation diffusion facilitator family transporter [Thermosediminibacter oceani]ADL06953.1 cation diffusion facilitator family transporter [Thermosediminibacter oceani DSM 16646]